MTPVKLKLNITAGIQVNTIFSDCALMVSELCTYGF